MRFLGTFLALSVVVVLPASAADGDPPPPPRGPAQDLVVEAGVGYAAGAFSEIQGINPKVAHGMVFHFAVGWAWTIRPNQSVGLELTADGMVDGQRVNGLEATGSIGGRYGAQAFVVGERAHLRIGAGMARTRYQVDPSRPDPYTGIGVTFAAGYHVPLMPNSKGWKRPYLTVDIAPSWDFLGAGSDTLHRWTFGLLIGLAVY